MADLPFYFLPPTPRYFRDNGFFRDQKNLAFVTWCFERCTPYPRTIFFDGKYIDLLPYEFTFGRVLCSIETGLTEQQVRSQIKQWSNLGLVKKATNKTTKRFSVYMWVIEAFSKNDNQENNQEITKKQPTNNHPYKIKDRRLKESHPIQTFPSPDQDLTDFFSQAQQAKAQPKERKSLLEPSGSGKVLVAPGVEMSQDELDACLAIKGSLDAVREAVGVITRSPKRRFAIKDWPKALAKWEIKNEILPLMKEHESLGEKLENQFSEFVNGWRCRVFLDRKKDQKGLLFECESAYVSSVFVPFIDKDFKKKTSQLLVDRKMQKAAITKNNKNR